MTTKLNHVSGQGSRDMNNEKLAKSGTLKRRFFLMIALLLMGSFVSVTAHSRYVMADNTAIYMPVPPNKGTEVTMSSPVGAGGYVSAEMDAGYSSAHPGCLAYAILSADLSTIVAYSPGNNCLPSTGEIDICVITCHESNGDVHARYLMRVHDGIVELVDVNL